ncbi:UNVERIFIED_CONTAM: hypothetical protein Sradi_7093600 [Sesamum radiatum]|uniref:Reverse transcriptase Ty1/copia-type domain-containing protein n=1 Tax=Sesamum radiatum TaxID=300843 RepID=A0AAW2J3R7_SESRA
MGDKLDMRSSLCWFIGYPKEIVGYYFYYPSEQKSLYLAKHCVLGKGFPSDSRRDEILLEESSEVSHDTLEMASMCIVTIDSVPVFRRSARVPNHREMNVKTAFLNSFVEKVIYMDQLEHFTSVERAEVAYLVLYVDDILLIGNDVKMLGDTKAWLSTQFFMKDMGEASYILSIKIYRDRSRGMLGMT